MTAGQAAYKEHSKHKCVEAWEVLSIAAQERWEATATAARAWKEPTLGDVAWRAFWRDDPDALHTCDDTRTEANKSCWEAAAQAVALVERTAIRNMVRDSLALDGDEPLRQAILAAIDARGK